jgi:hypothetical protein
MTDKNLLRCSICGAWTYVYDHDKLKLLMGEQLICDPCKKMGVKRSVA